MVSVLFKSCNKHNR